MNSRILLAGLLAGLLGSAAAHSGEASFSAKPAAVKDGDKVKISFAVGAAEPHGRRARRRGRPSDL